MCMMCVRALLGAQDWKLDPSHEIVPMTLDEQKQNNFPCVKYRFQQFLKQFEYTNN